MSRKNLEFQKLSENIREWRLGKFAQIFPLISEPWTAHSNIIELVEAQPDNEKMLDAALKSTIVSTITLLEVYTKALIVRRKGLWDNEGLSKLLAERKIDMEYAYKLFSDHQNLSREELLVADLSFNCWKDINDIITCLHKKDFERGIKTRIRERESEPVPEGTLKLNLFVPKENWVQILNDMFKIRHKIIHEHYSTPINRKQFEEFRWEIICLLITVEGYFEMRDWTDEN